MDFEIGNGKDTLAEIEMQKGILVGVSFSGAGYMSSSDETILELEGLFETAGGQAVCVVEQNRMSPDPRTFVGEGKCEEIKKAVEDFGAQIVVFDNELSPSQIKNIANVVGAQVMDRSMLVLDIFAMRAMTSEGKIQVELAQLRYSMPRLIASYGDMSRLGGGIGTRGPGETQIEIDRRRIRERIKVLSDELERLKKNRNTQRQQRLRSTVPQIAIIGYTNAGKSTIFKLLTGADVLIEDRLFATLDPTARRSRVGTKDVIFVDTVGFIRNLPHHLVEAFRSTLEELCYCDILMYVVDASDGEFLEHLKVTRELVSELGAKDKPYITVYNKCDAADLSIVPKNEDSVFISATQNKNIDALYELIEKKIDELKAHLFVALPYEKAGLVDALYKRAKVMSIDYKDTNIEIELLIDRHLIDELSLWEYKTDG